MLFRSDQTRRAELREPSFNLLGFGTQFLDAQLDGHPDLVIANGHVDDYTYQGSPFQMPPQYLGNAGGVFVDQGAGAGDYFQRKLLGRGLSVGDFNRDGKPDFIVSHLDAPVAVLTNTTAQVGNFLAHKEAAEAISHLGTKILPDLLHMMEARNNRMNGFLSKLETKMFNGKTPRYSIVEYCRAPTMAIALFYEQAGIIKTDLEQLTKDGNPAIRDKATVLLEWIDRHDD